MWRSDRDTNAAFPPPPTYLGFENADFETLNTPEREKEREKKKGTKKRRAFISPLKESKRDREEDDEEEKELSLSACGIITTREEKRNKKTGLLG